jgi:hypothetical protein
MADFLLVIVTVVAVGLGAFHLGRQTQKDRIEYLLDELDAASSLTNDLLQLRQQSGPKHLRVVRDEV